MKWKIGCSGFSYREWEGYFYPESLPNTEWLEYYAQHFDSVELNATFYKPPTLPFLKNLYNRTPVDFCFVIKAPKLITHTQQFINCEKIISDFYSIVRNGLKEKSGSVLFQLPPSYQYSPQSLELIIENLNSSFRNVIEFRHKSWWKEAVFKKLAENNICFCSVSYPGLPAEPIINTDFVYYRFHGVPKLYYSMYDKSFLNSIAESIMQDKKVKEAFLLFNNTATRAALENASYLQEYVLL